MNDEVFVDTAYFVALLDPRDAKRLMALVMAEEFERKRTPLLTSDAVMIELGNYFSRSPNKAVVADFISWVRSRPSWQVIPLTPALLARAEARYRQFADKNWSLTDCVSMEVMVERRMIQIATTDRGFEQASFVVLMTDHPAP